MRNLATLAWKAGPWPLRNFSRRTAETESQRLWPERRNELVAASLG